MAIAVRGSKACIKMLILGALLWQSTTLPVLAQTSENSGKSQSPAQVVISIAICGVVLKVLHRYKVP